MNWAAVRTIVRREVIETLTDWRILIPIFILTVFLPQLLIAAANIAVEFIGDQNTVIRIVPFGMLLVGFIPASFSLITALEAFVGERERNSLEALLAMPINDTTLYLGKLLSSLTAPLLSSFLAISVFAISLAVRTPMLFAQGLTIEYFVIILLLIFTKSIVMVAGAVIISSHTTSIKAANLLASFVLLPTAAIIQLEALLVIAQRWDMMWIIAAGMAVIAAALIRTGLGSFNREEILSREHEQLNLRRIAGTFVMFFREFRPAGVNPDSYSGLRFSPGRFYRHELPALLHEYRHPLLIALIVAGAGLAVGPLFGGFFDRIGQSPQRVGFVPEPDLVFGVITGIANALRMLASTFASTLSFGLFAMLVPFFAFGGVSYISVALAAGGGSWLELGPQSPLQFLLGYVLPHGVVELPAAILGAAMGIRIGVALMSPPKGFTVGTNMLWALAQFAKVWLLVLLPMFVLAGILQQLISAQLLRLLYG